MSMRAGAALALAPLPLLAGACRRAPPPAGARECLLVTVDTLRDDFVSAYGSGLGATTHLDRLAAEGALFENHYAVVSHTCPSHATLFSGLFPREHGLLANG